MSELPRWDDLDVVLVDQDPVRRAAVARLARLLGAQRVETYADWSNAVIEGPVARPTVVLVDGALLGRKALELSSAASSDRLFVALVHGESGTTPEFLAAGFGAVLYDPITAVDLERVFALAHSVLSKAADRERRLQVKLSALRQVEADLTLLAEMTPDWLSRSLHLLQRILDVPALAVWKVDWEADALVNAGAVGLPVPFVRELEAKSRGRGVALVHRVLESLLVPVDMREDSTDDRVLTSAETRRTVGLEAGVVVPIRYSGRIVALLSVYLARLDDFARSDIQLYDSAAEALAVAWKIAENRRVMLQNQLLYRTLVEEEPVGVVLCGIDGSVRLANRAAARLLGYEGPDRLLGVRLPEAVRTLAPLPWDEWTQRAAGTSAVEAVVPILTLDKRLRIVEFHARVVELPGDGPGWEPQLQLVLADVTLERRRLMELELLHDLTRMVSEERDLEAAFRMVADRLQREFGYGLVGLALLSGDGTRFIGRAVRVEGGLTYNEWRADRGVTGRAVRENRAQLVVDVREDPDYFEPQPDFPMESEVVAVLRRNGEPIGVLNIESRRGHRLDQEDLRLAMNIAVHLELLMRQVELTEQLERQALSDPLTGLPNRRALQEHLRRLLRDRRIGTVSVILIDFDTFKTLNDTLGHLFGDAVLQAVSDRLVRSLRPSDLIARYGGDEFAVVLADVDLPLAQEIAERLRQAVGAAPFEVRGETVVLTISLGVAAYPRHGDTVETLLRAADEALYRVKRSGGNAVGVAGEEAPQL
ncbi:MAG: diguanylate cyclase [Thermomicrobium sp.]|nr:diguanylate cyclase [Thermomicrobium sp.]